MAVHRDARISGSSPPRPTRSGAARTAYNTLRKLLIEGTYPPGAHLREESVANRLGVSRTPVREAVRKLAAEGWLEIIQNQGAFVRKWSAEDIEEVLSLRAMLEGHAAGRAAQNATEAQIRALREICGRALALLPCADGPAVAEVAALNSRFHGLVIGASGQIRTAEILATLIELPITLRYFQHLEPDDMMRSVQEHHTLVEAIAQRDPYWASALMKAHVHGGKSLFLGRIAARDSPADAVAGEAESTARVSGAGDLTR
ncbi:GntR family transcriptional regulator [Pikeienuella piscinae]|uniref:GntR family transcriptional regulator n=1 Tax=Pikeienuella piscinae TaxID=2748098 RepID=A0A7L5BZS4_9RHOB|nr:GntR family transcriptional regulator [Pikeienuella piscinae]QIE56613.1 GntR family transcriptional regulator [Pikeienuella piscinae]